MLKRLLVEIGSGVDQHGQDPTQAAVKAVKDAVSKVCIVGLREVVGLQNLDDMVVDIVVAVPHPGMVREAEVFGAIPYGKKTLRAVEGGMTARGIAIPGLDDGSDEILVANAALTVMVDV